MKSLLVLSITLSSLATFAGSEYSKPSHVTNPDKTDASKDKPKDQKQPESSYKETLGSGTKEKKAGHYGPKSPEAQRPEGQPMPSPGSTGSGNH